MAFTSIPLFANQDPNDRERLNQIISNLNFLNQSRVQVNYNAYGVIQTDQIKIAVGVVDADNPNGGTRSRWVTAGNLFTPGSRPVGVASFASTVSRSATITIARRTADNATLDHTGLSAYVRNMLSGALNGPNYINWMMIGY